MTESRRKRKGPTPRRTPRRKPQASLPKIFLGYVFPRSPGLIHESFMRSVLRLYAGSIGKCMIQPMGIATGPLLSKARNTLLNYFLQGDYDYFLWADTDIEFDYEDLAVLMQSNRDIAGSVYLALDSKGEPVCAHLLEKDGSPGVYADVPLSLCYEDDGAPKEEVRVSGLGCGFTLIKREVIQRLADQKGGIKRLWPYAETGEDEGFGEDLTFGLRAAEMGFDSYLIPKSKVGHIKEIVL